MGLLPDIASLPKSQRSGFRRPPAASRLSVGDRAPYFSLSGTDGRVYSLADFNESRAIVVIFIGNRCPHSRRIEAELCRLQERYAPLGLSLVAICSNDSDAYPEDRLECMIETSQRTGFAFPYLHDLKQQVARAYDAACTPEAFLFDHELCLQYHGQPDILHIQETSIENSALIRAIDAVLFGHKPYVRYTECCGSSIKWKQQLIA